MKKKLLVTLAAIMCISLCACGGTETTSGNNKEEGFTPSQATEKEETEENDTETLVEIDVENLEKYYDTSKFVGTPRLVVMQAELVTENKEVITISPLSSTHDGVCAHIPNDNTLKSWAKYNCIITDNNTPDDRTDDELAYIFTTPVE